MISHDMGVIAGIADRVQVMRHGEVVETRPGGRHLLCAAARLYPHAAGGDPAPDRHAAACATAPGETLLDVEDLKVTFPVKGDGLFAKTQAIARRGWRELHAARRARRWAWWANRGCGKSTLARAVLQACCPPTAGRVVWLGRDLDDEHARTTSAPLRKDFQIVFQDPLASLDPAHAHRPVHRRAAAGAGAGTVARRSARAGARR